MPPQRESPGDAGDRRRRRPRPLSTTRLARPDLIERVRGFEGRVISLVAPAGYGKTTLIEEAHKASPGRWLWLSTRRTDNDPVALWDRLLGLSEFPDGSVGALGIRRLSVGGRGAIEGVVRQTAAAIADCDEPVVVVFDDLHHVDEPATLTSIDDLIQDAPDNLTVMLASRVVPGVRLGRLRGLGHVLDLRADDLAFTAEESRVYLMDLMGLPIKSDTADLAHVRTGGWPVALHLSALAMNSSANPSATAERIARQEQHLSDFLMEEVLGGLPDDLSTFALEVSVLPEMTALACDRLRRSHDAAAMIARLVERQLATTDDAGVARFHDLVRTILESELTVRDPARAQALRLSAAQSLCAEKRYLEAAASALAASDDELAADIADEGWFSYLAVGRIASAESLVEMVPRHVRLSDPRLMVASVWLGVANFSWEQAKPWVELAEGFPDQGPLTNGAASLHASLELAQGSGYWPDVGSQQRHAQRAFELEGQRTGPWQAQAHNCVAFTHILMGEPESAVPFAAEARSIARRWHQPLMEANSAAILGLAQALLGEAPAGLEQSQDALTLARNHGFEAYGYVAYFHLAAATARLRLRQYREAAEHLEQARKVHESAGNHFGVAWCLAIRAQLRADLGDEARAQADLSEAQSQADTLPEPGIITSELSRARKRLDELRRHKSAEPLSSREVEVLRLLAEGRSQAQAAKDLFLAYSTVHSHTKAIYRKLGVTSKEAALARAAQLSLLEPHGGDAARGGV